MSIASSAAGSGIASVLFKILAAIGFGAVSFVGVDLLLSQLTGQFQTIVMTLPVAILSLAGLCDLDLFFNALISAYTTVGILAFGKKLGFLP